VPSYLPLVTGTRHSRCSLPQPLKGEA